MNRPNLRQMLTIRKHLLKALVFLFFFLLASLVVIGGGYYKKAKTLQEARIQIEQEESYLGGKDIKRKYNNKRNASKDTSPQGKLIYSVRKALQKEPLRNPFILTKKIDNEENGKITKAESSEDKKPQKIYEGNQRSQSKIIAMNREIGGQDIEVRERKGNKVNINRTAVVKGIIWGQRPVALIEYNSHVDIYGLGEGPNGYKVISLTPHKVQLEGGIIWEE